MAYAGFWRRFAATLIDGVLLMLAYGALYVAMTGMGWDFHDKPTMAADSQGIYRPVEDLTWSPTWTFNAIGLAIEWLYISIMLSSPMQATVGKIVMGIYVTDLQGKRIGFGRATLRFIASIASAIVFFLGYLVMLVSGRRQTLHDMVAGTLVVHEFAPPQDIR